MKRMLIVLFFAVMELVSCRKQVADYKYPDFEPIPTLNAVFQRGEPIMVHLTLAQRLKAVHPMPCSNAEVLLYKDGLFEERLNHETNGLYTGSTLAEALHEYSCKVIVPGFDTLFATTQVPEQPVVRDVTIIENATVDSDGNACPAILFAFKTRPREQLYYQSTIDAVFVYDYYTKGLLCYSSCASGTMNNSINTDDPVLLNEGSDLLLFSNEIINDTIYTMKVNAFFNGHSHASYGYGDDFVADSIVRTGYVVVKMSGLSESCYRYRKSQEAYQAPDAYSNLFLGTVEPLNLYSNVENGKGVFAAIAPVICDTVFIH